MCDRMTDPHSVSAVGQFLRLQTRSFLLPDGTSVLMDWVGHPGAAAVVAVDGDGRICLLRQYRPIMGAWMWEIPAGKRDAGEAPEVAARAGRGDGPDGVRMAGSGADLAESGILR